MVISKNPEFPDIGVAIIVKDAEESIEKAIKSVQHICRQIVVVDTGSIDSTPSICKRLGAEVHFYNWNNDFSEARNYGLQFLRTDWILAIDSDEVLAVDTLHMNLEFFKIENAGGLQVKIINYLGNDDEGATSEHLYTRIFRNHRDIRYKGSIHEQIADSIELLGLELIQSNIEIYHYGYIKASDDKISRNREMLMKELEKNPDDSWLMFHLAETEFSGGRNSEAKVLFEKILHFESLPVAYYEKTRIRLAQISLNYGDYDSSIQFSEFLSNDIHLEGMRKYVLAAASLMQHDFDKAKELYYSREVSESNLVSDSELQKAKEILKTLKK